MAHKVDDEALVFITVCRKPWIKCVLASSECIWRHWHDNFGARVWAVEQKGHLHKQPAHINLFYMVKVCKGQLALKVFQGQNQSTCTKIHIHCMFSLVIYLRKKKHCGCSYFQIEVGPWSRFYTELRLVSNCRSLVSLLLYKPDAVYSTWILPEF